MSENNKNISNDGPAVLVHAGQELVVKQLPDGGAVVGVLLKAAHHEVLGGLGNDGVLGEVDLLLDLRGGKGTILTMSLWCLISKGMVP
jgi:hypothetical protein